MILATFRPRSFRHVAYQAYLSGELEDLELDREELDAAIGSACRRHPAIA